jgi:hypothetical protein
MHKKERISDTVIHGFKKILYRSNAYSQEKSLYNNRGRHHHRHDPAEIHQSTAKH